MSNRVARIISLITALTGFVIGSAALAGRISHQDFLLPLFHGHNTMKFNVAFCLELASIALLLDYFKINQKLKFNAGAFLASIVCLFGLLTLVEYILGINLGIDELFLRDDVPTIGHIHAGRMAPLSAIKFLLLGLAIFRLHNERSLNFQFYVSFGVAFMSFLMLLGNVLFADIPFIFVQAVPAALAFFSISASIYYCQPMLRRRFAFEHKLIMGFFPTIILIMTIITFSLYYNNEFTQNAQWVENTHEVLTEIEQTLSLERDIGVQGFLISGDSAFLENYTLARTRIAGELKVLRGFGQNDTSFKVIIDSLELLTNERLAFAERFVALKNEGKFNLSMQTDFAVQSKAKSDKVRSLLSHLRNDEMNLLNDRKSLDAKSRKAFNITFYVLFACVLMMVVVLFIIIRYNLFRRARAEERLKESEERFRLLVEGVKDYAIFMLDTSGNVMSWNEGAKQITGYSAKEVNGKPIAIFHPKDSIEKKEPELELEVAREKGRYQGESLRIRKDNSLFWADIVITALYDKTGKLRGFSKLIRDVTERKKALEIKARQEALTQIMPDAIFYGNRRMSITGMNEVAEQMFGITRGQAIGKRLNEIAAVTYLDNSQDEIYKAIWQSEGQWRGELLITTIDDRRVSILGTIKVIREEGGYDSGWIGIFTDITAVKVTEERLQLVNEGTAAGVWDWDIKNNKRWWSPRYFELLGYSPNEIDPSRELLNQLVHPMDAKALFAKIDEHAHKPGRFEAEARYKTKSGKYKWFLITATSQSDEQGRVVRMVGSNIDIDEKKKAQVLVNQQATLIQMMPDGIIYGDMRFNVVSLNRGAEELLGISSADAKGKNLDDLALFTTVGSSKDESRKTFLDKGYLRSEIEVTNHEGKKFIVLANIKMLDNLVDTEPGWVAIYTDIGPLRLNEELKEALKKLENNNQYLEQLAYISSHDIKAPIIALDSLAQMLIKTDGIKEQYKEIFKMMVTTILQMQRTNHSLNNILKLRKNLLQKDDANDQSFSLESILGDVVETLQTNIDSSGAEIKMELNGVSQVHFPYVHLRSIFYNLLNNAIKYRDVQRPLKIMVGATKLNNGCFQFIIEDNGLGMDLEYGKEKLFGIFKRFHDHVEGAGIGLHIVKSIIDAYGGKIEVASEVGKGTRFEITFQSANFE